MKRAILLFIVAASAILAVFLGFKTRQFDQSGYARFDTSLRRLKQLDTTFSGEVLKVRFKLLDNYDDFPLYEQELAKLSAELKTAPAFMDAGGRASISNLLSGYSALLEQRAEMFEEFKSQNAVLNNSLNYFPTTGEELMGRISQEADGREFQNQVDNFLHETLAYSLNPGQDPSDVQRCIDWGRNWCARHPNHADAPLMSSLLLHARTILMRKPVVDQLTRQLVSLPTGEKLEEIFQVYQFQLTRALNQASVFRLLLYVVGLAFAIGIICTLAALRANNRSLEARVRERTDQLTQANLELQTEMAERQRAQSELLQTSRMAGMAEVATSVLHNVGNVLNSVNVSANSIADQLKQSRVTSLAKVSDLLREHAADLGGFMTHDPKGKKLPAYLGQLAEHLMEARTSLLNEAGSLTKNVDHIKDIVAMQQSYVKVSGAMETVKVTELVEDALRMNASALSRHDIQFVREYEAAPPQITVEKHKVLQILVNLISNAKQACDESGLTEKLITVRVTNGADRVRIALADNGVGIPADNLTRIFNHGFTTKKNGHGFGLHGSALAAKELGGSLSARSDGPGHGATFTLELPCEPKEQSA